MKRREEGRPTPDPNLHSNHDIRVFKHFYRNVMRQRIDIYEEDE